MVSGVGFLSVFCALSFFCSCARTPRSAAAAAGIAIAGMLFRPVRWWPFADLRFISCCTPIAMHLARNSFHLALSGCCRCRFDFLLRSAFCLRAALAAVVCCCGGGGDGGVGGQQASFHYATDPFRPSSSSIRSLADREQSDREWANSLWS